MRELVWTGFLTADGIADSPGGAVEGHPLGGWVFRTPFDPAAYALKDEELADTSALLFGRRSYEAFAPIWRDSADHAAYRDLPKLVVSSTLTDADLLPGWGETRVLRSVDEVRALREGEGGDIFVHGSAALATSLAEADLIDRYNLLIFPVLLGSGKRVFPAERSADRALELVESQAYGNGVIKAVYRVVR